MNLQESIKNAKAKNYSISYYSEEGEVKEGEPFVRIGFKNNRTAKSKHVWYWFDVAYKNENLAFFSHSYSCNTGKVVKTYRKGYEFEMSSNK